MDFDLNKRHCFYFDAITKIPHPSYHEEKLSNWIVEWAKKKGLRYSQDDLFNVIVRKDASEGYENSPVLGLQAHIDMVAEKNSDVSHDFLNDPLTTYVDPQGWLHASGTTLGADDGTGVAYMLAILEDEKLKHPPLECIFTVQEEVGLIGAMHLKKEDISAHRIISLDGGGEYVTAVSAAGGCDCRVTFQPQFAANEKRTFQLKVSGLTGGHSGGMIHLEKGNAIKLLGRILKELDFQGVPIQLASLSGGAKTNAIAREACCQIVGDFSREDLESRTRKTVKDISEELEFSDNGFQLEIREEAKAGKCMSLESSRQVMDFIYLVPNGFRHRSMAIENLTLTSLNFGILSMEENEVRMDISIRSALDSGLSHLRETIQVLAEYLGAQVESSGMYPGWKYKEKSLMRDIMNQAVREQYDREIETRAGHGGCECGVFCAMHDDMDILSMGPIAQDIHTPNEKLDLESFDRVYKLLVRIMELCR